MILKRYVYQTKEIIITGNSMIKIVGGTGASAFALGCLGGFGGK